MSSAAQPHEDEAMRNVDVPAGARPPQDAGVPEHPITLRETWPLIALALLIAAGCQFAGALTIPLGKFGSIVLFPMVFALIIGGIVSTQKIRAMPLRMQKIANAFLSTAVLFLVARLAFNIGPSLPQLAHAGPALILQEIGHLLGTVFLALPLAVLLKMGPATIGATFSLDREPAFAMVNEKYGPDSDQYRGVLAMYVFGTLFGAVFITLLTSLIVSWGWFDPRALAMAAGVGSGSMMAASLGIITADFPELGTELGALAAVSNLITTVLGVYVGLWVALPLADKFYHLLTRRQASTSAKVSDEQAESNRALRELQARSAAPVHVPDWVTLPVMALIGVATAGIAVVVTNRIKHTHTAIPWTQILLGYAIIVGLIVVSMLLHKLTRVISTIIWVTTIGALSSAPFVPFGPTLAKAVGSIDFLSICTVVLTFAGLSVGKDIPILARIGWKIIPVGLVAITASFVFAAIIAEFTLGIWHV